MLCQTVQWLDSAVSNTPMVGQCCVQLSDGWWAECPTVQWSDCALSNCPMVGQCCVQMSEGQIVLFQTVQWSDSAVSNSPMVSQCCVKLSDGWSAECSTVQWTACALSNCPMVTVLFQTVQWLDSAVFIALNCLGGCIHIFVYFTYFSKMSRNFAHFVGQFGIKNLILSDSLKFSAPMQLSDPF